MWGTQPPALKSCSFEGSNLRTDQHYGASAT